MLIDRNSLAMRLSLIISLTIIAVFLVIGLTTYSNMHSQLLSHLKIETKMKEESISREIQNNFENARIITEQMAYNHEITTYLKSTNTRFEITNNPLYPSVLKTLVEIRNSTKTDSLVWVSNGKANFYLGSDGSISDATYDVKKRPWYPIAIRNIDQASYSEPYIDWDTKELVMSSIMALAEKGKIFGFVAIDMQLNQLPAVFSKYSSLPTEEHFLVNQDGLYIYHPDQKLVLNRDFTIKTNQLKDYTKEILSGKAGFEQIKYKNSYYYLSYSPAADTNWVIISLVKESVLTKELAPFTELLLLLFGLTVLFLVIFVYITAIQKMKPIGIIADYASIIASGDFSSNLPDIYVSRKDEMGTMARAFQIITDTFREENITLERKIQEKNRELEQQYKHLIETEKMAALGSLVAGVAHEINTPLGIGLSSSSFISKINSENRQKLAEGKMTKQDLEAFMQQLNETTEMLDNNLNRAAELVKSFKQVAVDQSSENLLRFSLKDTIDGVILSLRHEYKHQEHKIINNCPEELMLNSFPGAFSQVFTNLIMNSIQHGFVNKTNGTMQFDCIIKNNEMQIIYTDDGIGIPEEIIGRIFEPFFTTNKQQGNSGLGMYIVFNIVTQKLKGAISCENRTEGGVRFIIELPVS